MSPRTAHLGVAGFFGLPLVAIGSLVALLAILGSAPAVPTFGIWYQSEPVTVYVMLAAAVAGLGCGLAALTRPWVRRLLVHPVPLICWGVAIWSTIGAIFQPVPLASLWGSPEVGEGILWYLEFGTLATAGMLVARWKAMRRALALIALLVAGGISWATWMSQHDGPEIWAPLFFPDYLAFLDIGLIAILASQFFLGDRSRLIWPVLALGAGIALVSTNYATMGLMAVCIPAMAFGGRWLLGSDRQARVRGTALGILVPLAVSATVALPFIQELVNPQSLLGRMANSALSRHHLANVVVDATAANPSLLLTGSGWGSFSDLLAIHLPMDWAILRDDPNHPRGEWWDAIHRVDFHSHNYLLDALLGGGLVATVLVLVLTGAVPLWARRRHLGMATFFSVVLGGTAAYWFQLQGTMPYIALGMGMLVGPAKWSIKFPTRQLRWLVPVLLAVSLGLGSMATIRFRLSLSAFDFMPTMDRPLAPSAPDKTCPADLNTVGLGDQHLMYRLRTVSSAVVGALKRKEEPNSLVIQALRGLACAAEEHIDRGAAFRLLVATLLARSDLAFASPDPAVDGFVREFLVNWDARLTQALAIAPRRTDLAAPYLLWLLKENRGPEFSAWANRLYARNPQDMVGLWFSGIALLDDPTQTLAAVERMRKALDLGIERIIPVEDQLKRELGR